MRKVSLLSSLAILASLAVHSTAQPASQASPTSFAIKGCRIEIGDGRVIAEGTITVSGGKIIRVADDLVVPADMMVINGNGKTVYPGFIDAYSTRLTKAAPDPKTDGRPDASLTAPAYMWVGNRKGIYADYVVANSLDFDKDELSYESGITTSMVAPTKGTIRGMASLIDLLPNPSKDRVLAANAAMTMTFRGGAGEGYPSNILGVVALLRQILADAKSVSEGAVLSTDEKKPFWMASIDALQPVVTGKLPGLFTASTAREIERCAMVSDEFGFKFIVAGGRDAYKVIPMLQEKKAAVLLNVDYGKEPTLTAPANVAPGDAVPQEVRDERLATWKEQINGVATLINSGVPVAFGSDTSPNSFLSSVRILMKYGVTRDGALKAMTVTPATLFGVSDKLGTLEVGKNANLVMMDGDFAAEATKIEGVWISGQRVLEAKKEVSK